MRITALGVGSAFTLKNYQTMYLLENDGHKLMIDCGGDARYAIEAAAMTVADIEAVYISHLHTDHIGGLEWLGFNNYWNPNLSKPDMYISASLREDLWSKSLSGGMGCDQGKITTLDDFFNVHALVANEEVEWYGLKLRPIQTMHVMNGFSFVPSFGLIIKSENTTVFVTTDTQDNPNQLKDFYEMSDVIYHDCETAEFKSGVHAHYSELITLPKETKNKMWFTHYNDNVDAEFEQRAIEDDFQGFFLQGTSHTYE